MLPTWWRRLVNRHSKSTKRGRTGTCLRARYHAGDSTFAANTSAALTQAINKAASTTVLTSSANPAAFGQPVTFTASVTVVSAMGTPTGTVTFMDGSTGLITLPLNLSGLALFFAPPLTPGTHTITAIYNGDSNFSSSSSSAVNQTVLPGVTTTVVASSANPSVFGQPVSLTATVSAVLPVFGPLTGTVTFRDGDTTLGTATLNASGVATLTAATLRVGTHTIAAVYAGVGTFATSTSAALTQAVNKAASTTVLTSSANPSVFGSPVTFTATFSTATLTIGTPLGTVTFRDGTTTLGTGTLDASGVATLTTSGLAVGTLMITAVYNGDTNFAPNTSAALTQTITLALLVPSTPGTPSPPALPSTPAPQPAGTPSVDAGLIALALNGVALRSANSVIGQLSTSSGTAFSGETIGATPSRPSSASAGQGSGSDEIAGQRHDVRPGDLLSPRFEPGLPARDDIISGVDLAGSLLTGVRPTASLLPQKGTSIAPVATVLTTGAGDDQAILTDPSAEEKSMWPNFVIGLDDTIDRRPVVPLEKPPGISRAAEAPERRLAVIDQIFEQGLPAVLDEIVARGDHPASTSFPRSSPSLSGMVPALASLARGKRTRSDSPVREVITRLLQSGTTTIGVFSGLIRIPFRAEAATSPAGLDVLEAQTALSIDQENEIPSQDATPCSAIVPDTAPEQANTLSGMLGATLFLAAIFQARGSERSSDSRQLAKSSGDHRNGCPGGSSRPSKGSYRLTASRSCFPAKTG